VCVVRIDGAPVAIGAIKRATVRDFDDAHSGLASLHDAFEWELGYLYTDAAHERQGIASYVVRLLLRVHGPGNLMASTEISSGSGMVGILERNGFRFMGRPWRSERHTRYLGLFLRFE
jgi:hypothetical protein